MTLTPAYGRDYKSQKEVMADVEANKDFIIRDITSPLDGKPASPSDFKGQTVQIRYGRSLAKVMVVNL